jgi:hypothetical protein
MMSQRIFSVTAGVIFALIALGHILRVVFALEWTVQDRAIPMWASWLALLIATYLASQGFRLGKKSQ